MSYWNIIKFSTTATLVCMKYYMQFIFIISGMKCDLRLEHIMPVS